ncbi:MAG TPA: 30S ribosomal protein S8 [Candidatus Saccharimonadales bacterium]|nr:30S ribosomal protein S8 [Candidatus Saccharimonadales bacterium]
MVSTDPISDMLTRVRNAILINKNQVSLPYSKIKEDVAQILVSSGFLKSANVTEEGINKTLNIEIADADQPAVITEIKRLSSPGRRVYVQSKEIPKVKRGRGIVIVSTSQGVMAGADAKAKKLGGELICEVY